jgi:membrane-associated phospholipid phosphatase
MRRPLFDSGIGVTSTEFTATDSWIPQRLQRFWVPLQNVMIVVAAAALPHAFGIGRSRLFAILAILILISVRSSGGRVARATQFFFGYGVLCTLFGDIRGVADSTPWVGANLNDVWRIERTLFNGELPSARLQRLFYQPGHTSHLDDLMLAVYVSFFFIPLIAGVVVAIRNWQRSKTMLIAQLFVFALGFLLILAWPSNPPWLTTDSALNTSSDAEHRVYRVTTITLGQGDDYAYGADKNRVAAMPSIHLANTTLVLLLLWSYGLSWRIIGGSYVAVMSFAVVYLGEHFVLDVFAGIALAICSWQLAYVWQRRGQAAVLDRLGPLGRFAGALVPGSRRTVKQPEYADYPSV